MEMDAGRAETARQNFVRAGVDGRVSVIVGDASRFLHKVAGPFDLIFQDGSKQLYEPLLDRLASETRLFTAFLTVGDGVALSVKLP